jgi:tRNA (guanine26-N2/guanine27-N2)-dimethyltransferase
MASNILSQGEEPLVTIPEGYVLHTENTSHILLPTENEAFLNPVQEFNRDLSVACIRVWSEELNKVKEAKWQQSRERKRLKTDKEIADQRRSQWPSEN